ncbi:uncharacterized protein LOC126840617 [Adelges cooleyi]|uniref:uncharacterized protein LOC126840617 n=1 Tax=Adelges cooleyi TaxID=133065 RepID=UPI00218010C3|nr:uncharacterized protein LOC126840617 [Adelges cooleyi]
MRKYQQLFLVIISFVSIFSLLTYRYEYMKLLNVLEVLNFFGYPTDGLANCTILNETFYADLENDNRFAKPPVTWTKIDQYFAYSAFWSNEDKMAFITMLGPKTAFSGFDCRIWFRLADHYISSPGSFSYDILPNVHNNDFHQYKVLCKPSDVPLDTTPYGILLGRENSLKLFVPLRTQDEARRDNDNLVICVAPDYSGVPDTDLVEFIAYHILLGIRHFIIYDIGIHHQVLNFLHSIAGRKGIHKTLSTLSWQFPVVDNDLEKSVLLKDCTMRTQGLTKHRILLSWNEYLVFNKDRHFINIDQDDTDYAFEIKTCCSKRQIKKSWPIALRKTLCVRTNETLTIANGSGKMSNQSPLIAGSIHKLEDMCKNIIGKDDKSMAKYMTDFVNSKLLNLWKSHVQYSIMRTKNYNTFIN